MKRKHLSAFIAATISTLSSSYLMADTKKQDDSWVVETIVITGQQQSISVSDASTATRTPTPIEKIPQSIQVLSRNLLEEQDLQNLSDALNNVSGVTPSSSMQTVLMGPSVRGFGTTYYYDGLPAYQLPAGVSDPATLINVERIEVAKGPSSSLYGGGTGAPLAGLINVVSRNPSADPSAEIILRGGSFNTRGVQALVNTPVGEQVAFSLAGMHEESESFIDEVESKRYALFPSLNWIISDSTRLKFRGQINHLEQLEYSGLPVELIEKVDSFTFAGAEDAPFTEVDNQMFTLSLQHSFSESLSGDVSVRHYKSEFAEYSTYPLSPAAVYYPGSLDTQYVFGSGQVPSEVEQTFVTASLLKQFSTGSIKHQLLTGVDYDATDYYGAMGLNFAWGLVDYADASTNANFGAVPEISDVQNDDLKSQAIFVQDQMSLTEKLDLTASLRWTSIEVKSLYNSLGVDLADGDEKETQWSPRLGVTYELVDGVSAFAGYAEGFKGVVAAMGVVDPEAETSQSYEAGFKFHEPVDGLTGTVALFEITRQNVITSDPSNPFLSIQTGEQRARGIETDFIYEPISSLSLLLNYAYTKAEVTEDNRIPEGDLLRAIPEHKGRIAVRYRFASGALDPLEIGAGVTYTSERELTIPNTTSIGGSSVFDLQASWDFEAASLGLSVINLFDDDSHEPYQYFGGQYVIPVQPRSVNLSVIKTF
jgi:iron complex outermembrane recepter protein